MTGKQSCVLHRISSTVTSQMHKMIQFFWEAQILFAHWSMRRIVPSPAAWSIVTFGCSLTCSVERDNRPIAAIRLLRSSQPGLR